MDDLSERDMQLIRDMIQDSRPLEQQGDFSQAFDKLIRGILCAMNGLYEGASLASGATSYFRRYTSAELHWRYLYSRCQAIEMLCYELASYLTDPGDREALKRRGGSIRDARLSQDRDLAAERLAKLVILVRNSRFHGDPSFSGRNVRVAKHVPALLEVMRDSLGALVDEEGE